MILPFVHSRFQNHYSNPCSGAGLHHRLRMCRNMRTALNHSNLTSVIGIICCLLMTGCKAHSSVATLGAPAPHTVSASRIRLPAAGGQTIQVPGEMSADAYELWHPLNQEEHKRFRNVSAIPVGPFDAGLGIRLSPAGAEAMGQYLYRLTHSRKNIATRALGRAESYLPLILEALEARGLPAELACLPMVESAFDPGAVSPAGAAGLWQLMPGTARRFGLTVNSEVDERFDVRKSTVAATTYLASLHDLFGDWSLALAAYNCGEGAMQLALNRTSTETLPDLINACRLQYESGAPLAEETLRFVPQFAAAVQVMHNSDVFGLTGRAALQPEPQSMPRQGRESPLTLIGRYDIAPQSRIQPARSRRIE